MLNKFFKSFGKKNSLQSVQSPQSLSKQSPATQQLSPSHQSQSSEKLTKHNLFCRVEGYTDMAHFLYNMNFKNNTKYLYNFDRIKKDIEDYFYSNMYDYVHVIHISHNGITTRHFTLIDLKKNMSEFALEYENVIVNIKIKWL